MKVTKTGRIIVASALVLAGCAAPGGTTVPQMTQVNYYPQCYQSVGLLRQQDQQFQQVMAVNTLAGAAGGAALGAIASGGNWRGALIGAAAGGLVAASATYASARMQQEADAQRRQLLIANDMSHDYGEMQRAVVAARQADYCYGMAYGQLAANVRRGVVPKPEAAQRFTEIDQGEHEVAAILAEYGKKSVASQQQYQAAFDQEARQMNTTPSQLQADAGPPSPSSGGRAPRPTKQVSQNTRQMAQNYNRLNQQVSEINQEQSTIERTATARRDDMQALGVQVQS
jgi:hypothetical protein